MRASPFWIIGFLVALATAQGVSSQCASGEVVCCNMVKDATSVPEIPSITGMSTGAAANLGLVGSACTTLTVIGLPTGKSCAIKQVPLCCTDNNYNGTLSLGCAYINPTMMS